MHRSLWAGPIAARVRRPRRGPAGLALAALVVALAAGADGAPGRPNGGPGFDLDSLGAQARRVGRSGAAWYEATPAPDRVTWGGLVAAAALGAGVLFERTVRLRRRRVLPDEFTARFMERLRGGKLDRGKALDFCELNPSPASRVALAAVRRWGRPVTDLERAVSLAHRVEAADLRRHVGTLRRVAALTPLIGLLGTLMATGRALSALGTGAAAGAAWGPALAAALGPLTAGVAVSILALVAYDGLAGRVEAFAGELDRVGAETVDAVVMALPPEPRPVSAPGHASPLPPARTPHQVRLEVPKPSPRGARDVDDDYE